MKKYIIRLFAVLFISIFLFSQIIIIFAHENVLLVESDSFKPEFDEFNELVPNCDGEDEMWYYTKRPVIDFLGMVINGEYHIDDEVETIKYYFEPTSFLSSYTWTTDIYKIYKNYVT